MNTSNKPKKQTKRDFITHRSAQTCYSLQVLVSHPASHGEHKYSFPRHAQNTDRLDQFASCIWMKHEKSIFKTNKRHNHKLYRTSSQARVWVRDLNVILLAVHWLTIFCGVSCWIKDELQASRKQNMTIKLTFRWWWWWWNAKHFHF